MIIYFALNTINGKYYVGKTSTSLKKRWGLHRFHAKHRHSVYFHKALRKYGERNFEVRVLFDSECSEKELEILEKYYISYFQSNKKEYGYNLTEGGEGVTGRVDSEETRKKRRNSIHGNGSPMLGVKRTEKEKEFLKLLNTGEGNPFFGRFHTKETKDKISETKVKQHSLGNHPWINRKHSEESKNKMSRAWDSKIPAAKEGYKICNFCTKELLANAENFTKDKTCRGGFSTKCKSCKHLEYVDKRNKKIGAEF